MTPEEIQAKMQEMMEKAKQILASIKLPPGR